MVQETKIGLKLLVGFKVSLLFEVSGAMYCCWSEPCCVHSALEMKCPLAIHTDVYSLIEGNGWVHSCSVPLAHRATSVQQLIGLGALMSFNRWRHHVVHIGLIH